MIKSIISGLGTYIPEKRLTNYDLEKMVETSDEWIVQRTGIRERRIATDETTVMMAKNAVLDLAVTYKKEITDVDFIIFSSSTSEHKIPSLSSQLSDQLNIKSAACYDLSAACAGFTYGLITAQALISTESFKKILIVASEVLSRYTDYTDRSTCILFGDGAGVALVEPSDKGTLYTPVSGTDGQYGHLLYLSEGADELNGQSVKNNNRIVQDGKRVFKWAIEKMSLKFSELLMINNFTKEDIDYFIPHSANQRIIDGICSAVDFPQEKTLSSVKEFGNTSAVSIPLALAKGIKENKVKKGDKLLLLGFGGGLTYSGIIINWLT